MRPETAKHYRDWSFHATINAIPSFSIAVSSGWDRPESIAGMIIGVAIFTIIFGSISSSRFYTSKIQSGFLGRCVHIGRILRSVIAGFALIGWFIEFFPLFIVDLYAGLFATSMSAELFGFPQLEPTITPVGMESQIAPLMGDAGALLPTITTVLIEGALLATFMVLLAIPIMGIVRFVKWLQTH